MQIEKNVARKYHRIELPARVSINDKFYEVKDWSLGGFLATCSLGEFTSGWQGEIKLILPFQDVEVSFDIPAKVAWANEDKVGFSFVEVSDRIKAILKSYVEASIEGRLGEIDGVIARLDGVELPLEVETPMSEDEKKAFKRAFYWRSTLYWLGGLASFGFIAAVIFFSMTHFTSVRAIVSAPLINIDSPFEGVVASISVTEGQHVKKGQILATLDDKELLRQVEKQRQTLTVSKRELAAARVQLAEEEKSLTLYQAAASRTLANLEAERAAIKARVDLAEKEFKRARTLVATKAVSMSFHDEADKTLRAESSLLKAINERIELARVNEQSSRQGRYLSNNGEVRGEVAQLSALVEVKEARIQEEEAKLHELLRSLEKTRLLSPCESEVYAIKQTPGTSMHHGDSFLLLRPTSTEERSWVIARFTFDEAQSISLGTEVEVFLPALSMVLRGHVQTIGYQMLSGPRLIPPDMEISFSELPVKIRLEDQAPPLQIGMAAVVKARIPFKSRLEAKFSRIL